jgi:hypothetical protein
MAVLLIVDATAGEAAVLMRLVGFHAENQQATAYLPATIPPGDASSSM